MSNPVQEEVGNFLVNQNKSIHSKNLCATLNFATNVVLKFFKPEELRGFPKYACPWKSRYHPAVRLRGKCWSSIFEIYSKIAFERVKISSKSVWFQNNCIVTARIHRYNKYTEKYIFKGIFGFGFPIFISKMKSFWHQVLYFTSLKVGKKCQTY